MSAIYPILPLLNGKTSPEYVLEFEFPLPEGTYELYLWNKFWQSTVGGFPINKYERCSYSVGSCTSGKMDVIIYDHYGNILKKETYDLSYFTQGYNALITVKVPNGAFKCLIKLYGGIAFGISLFNCSKSNTPLYSTCSEVVKHFIFTLIQVDILYSGTSETIYLKAIVIAQEVPQPESKIVTYGQYAKFSIPFKIVSVMCPDIVNPYPILFKFYSDLGGTVKVTYSTGCSETINVPPGEYVYLTSCELKEGEWLESMDIEATCEGVLQIYFAIVFRPIPNISQSSS